MGEKVFIVKRQIEQCFSCIIWQEQAKDEDDVRFCTTPTHMNWIFIVLAH